MKPAGISARRRASTAPAFSMMVRAAVLSLLPEAGMEPRALSIGAGSCPKTGRQVLAWCATRAWIEMDRSFHVLCRRVESNKRIHDDAVTNVRKPAHLPPLTAGNKRQKGALRVISRMRITL